MYFVLSISIQVLNFSCQTSQQLKNNFYLVVRRGLLVLEEKFKVESWHLLCNFFSNKFGLVTFSRNKDKCFTIVFQMNIALNKILSEGASQAWVGAVSISSLQSRRFICEVGAEASLHHSWLHHRLELFIRLFTE